jgi:hypothetical protein
MSNESVCQVACSWVDVGSFHMHLFGVVYVACGDFHDGSEKGTASMHQTLSQSWESATETLTMIQQACGDQMFSRTEVFEWHACSRPVHDIKSSSVRIEVGPFTTLLRRWELVIGDVPKGSVEIIGNAPRLSQICAHAASP